MTEDNRTPTEKIFDEILSFSLTAGQRRVIEDCKEAALRDRKRFYAHIPMELYVKLMDIDKLCKKLVKENEELKIKLLEK